MSIVIVFVILVAGIAAVMFLPPQNAKPTTSTSTQTTEKPNVTVFGLVSTMGVGTNPPSMVFVNVKTGNVYNAPMTGNRFSIGLPNEVTYNVSLRWAGNYSWQNGEVLRGQLPINMSNGSMMSQSYNVVEVTPNSMVNVSGSISWQILSSRPASIKFTATDGEEFLTTVSQDRLFSISLPKMMAYEVNIGSQNATGYTAWYYAHQLQVNAGPKVIGLTVDISL